MLRLLVRLLLLITLTFSSPPMVAGTVLEIIPLQNRPAEEIQHLLTPLMQGEAVIVASGDNLLIKADTERLSEIKTIIKSLDKPLNNLLISVIQSNQINARELNARAALKTRIPLDHPQQSQVKMTGFYGNTAQLRDTDNTQTIRTLEGQPAYIKAGNLRPYNTVSIYSHPYTYPSIAVNTQLLETSTGFAVTPRLSGQYVTLEITPWSDNLSQSGVIETRHVHTTLRVKLNEWIEIGSTQENQQDEQQGFLTHQRSTVTQAMKIMLKVVKVENSTQKPKKKTKGSPDR
jgi:hypothetical protein